MLIGFVRHGETDWNAVGRIQGQTDIPLNQAGIGQAHALAKRLQREDKIWHSVLASDLKRAYETARILAESLQIPLLQGDKRLRERCFGEAEGLLRDEREERWGLDWIDKISGYESDEQVRSRGLAVVEELLASEPKNNVLIVAHGAFLAQMLSILCPELQDERISNLSYSIIQYEQNRWKPLLHNCTLHLGD